MYGFGSSGGRAVTAQLIARDCHNQSYLYCVLPLSLIKKYQPKFNIRLKDDKTYPYIMIDLNQDYPIIQFTRNINIKNLDRIRLFGPFSKAKEVRKTLSIINSLFPYRSCTKKITGNDARP